MCGKIYRGRDVIPPGIGSDQHEYRAERLIDRLPARLQTITRWLRRPSSRWVRLPTGMLLIAGAFLSILPFFGLWMAPLGLMLLAEDLPPLRRARNRVLAWIEHRRPQWFNPPPIEAQPSRRPRSRSAGGERKAAFE